MRPILLIGKNGQVGSQLLELLALTEGVAAVGRSELDLRSAQDIRRTIQEIQPKLILNAAAYTAVDQAETEEATARAINMDAPGVMAEEAKKIGAGLVHFSTDYIFDGTKKTPYDEADPPNPINVYGKTKLAGEEAIRAAGILHLILRTSWVYARQGKNFLLTILRLATEKEELRIVSDQTGAPTCASEIAAVTAKIIRGLDLRNDGGRKFLEKSGTYHLTAAGTTTWYEFAKAILEEAAKMSEPAPWFSAATQGRAIVLRRIIPITSQEYKTAARRPAYSVLSNARLNETFGIAMPEWRTQLQRCFGGE
jgi:dTDP-4-dehydrorhamnose reductase